MIGGVAPEQRAGSGEKLKHRRSPIKRPRSSGTVFPILAKKPEKVCQDAARSPALSDVKPEALTPDSLAVRGETFESRTRPPIKGDGASSPGQSGRIGGKHAAFLSQTPDKSNRGPFGSCRGRIASEPNSRLHNQNEKTRLPRSSASTFSNRGTTGTLMLLRTNLGAIFAQVNEKLI